MPELRPRPEVKDPGPELGWVPGGAKTPVPTPSPSTNPYASKGKARGKEEKRSEKEQRKSEKHGAPMSSPSRTAQTDAMLIRLDIASRAKQADTAHLNVPCAHPGPSSTSVSAVAVAFTAE